MLILKTNLLQCDWHSRDNLNITKISHLLMNVFVLQETLRELEEHPGEPRYTGINKMYMCTHFKYATPISFHCMSWATPVHIWYKTLCPISNHPLSTTSQLFISCSFLMATSISNFISFPRWSFILIVITMTPATFLNTFMPSDSSELATVNYTNTVP